MWVAVFLYTLLFTTLGLLLYVALPTVQISLGAEKLLLFVILMLLFVTLLVWKFWYKDALKKYTEEYGKKTKMSKMSKILLNNRTFYTGISLLILLGFGIGWFYFGHRRTQEILNAKPIKIYKAVDPLKTQTQPSNTREVLTSTHVHEQGTSLTPPISDMENTDTNSNSEQSDLLKNTKEVRDTPTFQENEEHEHEDAVSKEEREASKKLLAEAEKALEEAKHIQKEGLEMMREAMPIVANHLNTLSKEEQIEMLKQLKTTMLSQTSQFPPELQSLIEEHNVIEEGWKIYLDMLAEAGYTIPRNFQ